MSKALIVYGTRYGATEMTSNEIADVFRQEGLDTTVVNLKNGKVKDINDYDLVVVGSGIKIKKWTKEPEKFLNTFKNELANKKTALFICCGAKYPLDEKTNIETELEYARTHHLEEKAAKYNLQPISLGLFGGVYNFNRMGWFFKKTLSGVKPQLEEAGVPQTEPGLYDTRDINNIRNWAKDVAQKANS
ncbi:MAG: flavodoxin domain-containing protein [Candidatus Bathyarchaeota archaeon]|nr:flavodoxin domain-containing protein [Candidatus Bathyarchaeum tardum]WGM89382.1 MAG: flavodoxin domain-containing protein [Candidatus Bathyarchaeum tardum]